MFTKRKLAKIIENKRDDKKPINYNVLHKAKENVDWNEIGEVRVVDTKKQKLIIVATICCLVILISLGVYLGVILSKPQKEMFSPPIQYIPSDDKMYEYDSVQQYNVDNNLNLLHFSGYQTSSEFVKIYTDKDVDVLLTQKIILKETNEELEMYVQLKNNYIFDFLSDFDTIDSTIKIKDIQMLFDTKFDEQSRLYTTLVKFNFKGHLYKMSFSLQGEMDWQKELSKILI